MEMHVNKHLSSEMSSQSDCWRLASINNVAKLESMINFGSDFVSHMVHMWVRLYIAHISAPPPPLDECQHETTNDDCVVLACGKFLFFHSCSD